MSGELGISLDQKLDMDLNEVVSLQEKVERRPRGGGRFRGGPRYSSRRDEPKPYSRRPFPSPTGNSNTAGASTRVYVGNLAWQTSWQDLKDHMRSAGNVVRADVFQDESGRSKGCGIVEYSTPEEAQNAIKTLNDTSLTDTDRMIFVREDREDRNFAQAIQRPVRKVMGGSHRGMERYPSRGHRPDRYADRGRDRLERGFVDRPTGRSARGAQGRQVFVGNLPYTCSWQDLKDKFRVCGNIIRADVLLDMSGRSKGQGTVLFETSNEAQKAIGTFDGTDFSGRVITVHEDKFAQQ